MMMMKQKLLLLVRHRRKNRVLFLSLLYLSVLSPLLFFSHRLNLLAPLGKDFLEDLYRVAYKTDSLKLNAVEQEGAEELEEPNHVVYKVKDSVSTINYNSNQNNDSEESRIAGHRYELLERNVTGFDHDEIRKQGTKQKESSSMAGDKDIHVHSLRMPDDNIKVTNKDSGRKEGKHNQIVNSESHEVRNPKIEEIKDQILRAKTYLNLAPPSGNLRLKELELLMRELEQAVGEATQDSDLSASVLQSMRHMEASLSKAYRIFPNCCAMADKLQAMKHTTEQQVRSQRIQATFLAQLAGRTTPKGLHCLSMRLTAEYFAMRPEERKLPNENKIYSPELYHYAVFTDNVLACAVVVNSTVSTAKEPEKLVFHVVTNSHNLPGISMWFLLNPLDKATVHIQSIDNYGWFSKYNTLEKPNSSDPIYTSELNHLRFYLPDIFPTLNKIMLFDHDVVVQQDLSELWTADMNGNVIGAVGTCKEGEAPFHRMDMFINISDPLLGERFDVNACTWAFGMNLFDLQQWRMHNLTSLYHKYLQMNIGIQPLGWLTFYNKTTLLDRRWHVQGLGHNSGVDRNEIEHAAVIHYDGIRKPWLDIAMGRYKNYWTKFLKFDQPFLERCNLQP
ncbi:probable galacturonosyltransferase 6 isoform X1 [Arachis stenosperma]|uniref:probable galacturonosyltransferase 6 isoform X1 n=1 Tax=Arachis stenosperma TaxID=217475 RepID=UPI0025AD40C6|nr:probable galacturonosyltransferase 6 isoform X1 [Arachis stenosperma]